MKDKITTEQIIKRMQAIHGNAYDYSLVRYCRFKQKVKIICPKHGVFKATPDAHIQNKTGCPKCFRERKTKTTKWFIEQAKAIHGNKYDYSDVVYKKSASHVTVRCLQHGPFEVTPNNHLQGYDCPQCGKDQAADKNRKETKTFVEQALKVHGNIYDYGKVIYTGAHRHVIIGCPVHGDFKQTPANHLSEHECQRCAIASSKAEKKISKILEQNNITFEHQKTFEGCESNEGYSLWYDFYIPRCNLLVEYDGEHHFMPVRYSTTKKSAVSKFRVIQRRDQIKDNFAKQRGIGLLRIPYTQKKNVEQIVLGALGIDPGA